MIEEIRKLKRQHPFSPYTIVLDDGRKFVITDPFHVGFAGGQMMTIYDEPHDEFLRLYKSSVKSVIADDLVGQTSQQS